MGKKKAGSRSAPNMSSANSLSAAAATSKSNSSSILRSAFSPSKLQLSLFASVIQALDSQQLRIYDTTTGRIKCEYTASRAEITALDWGYYGSAYRLPDEQPSQKKRRKLEESSNSHGSRDIVVAVGTNQSHIHLFSPTESKVLVTLSNGHTDSIRGFKFKNYGLEGEAWSLGADGKLLQWNLRNSSKPKTIALLETSSSILLPLTDSVLVASHLTSLIDLASEGETIKLGQGTTTTQYLAANMPPEKSGQPTLYLAAFENDRFINVHDIASGQLKGSLVAEGDVTSVDICDAHNGFKALGALTTNGHVELFDDPFGFEAVSSTSDVKLKRQQMTKRAAAKIRFSKTDKSGSHIPIAALSFQESDLIVAYSESSAHLAFERIPWKPEEHTGLVLQGDINIEKAVSLVGISDANMNGVKDMGRMHIDENRAALRQGADATADAMVIDKPEVIDISSGEELDSDSDEEAQGQTTSKLLTNGVHADTVMGDASSSDEEVGVNGEDSSDEDDEAEEPSFGERLRAKAPETIDVAAAFPDDNSKTVALRQGTTPGRSLGTVLTQALRTNDTILLESCLHEQDLSVVRKTIDRLDSRSASLLLRKLAERLHSRPGRAGSLLVWVQWTVVAHGGYLGAQKETVKELMVLKQVVNDRAQSLIPLLSLKGKLDMLESQRNHRRSMQTGGATTGGEKGDEEIPTYVEGQESSSEDEADTGGALEEEDNSDEDSMEEDEDEDLIDDEYSEDDSENDLVDDIASETDDDGSEVESIEEVDHDDVDTSDDDEADETPSMPNGVKPKLKKR